MLSGRLHSLIGPCGGVDESWLDIHLTNQLSMSLTWCCFSSVLNRDSRFAESHLLISNFSLGSRGEASNPRSTAAANPVRATSTRNVELPEDSKGVGILSIEVKGLLT